jgi:dTDP-glucose pyrophosphorylase
MQPTLLILAAGIGSRFGGFKQLEPVGPSGELLLDFSLSDARKAGFGRIVFVISKAIEADFKAYMGSRYGKADFVYVLQEPGSELPEGFPVPSGRTKPWGTGHAVLAARHAIETPFAVINADDYYDSREQVMVGFRLENTLSEHGAVARGVCSVKDGFLSSIVEREKIRQEGGRVVFESADGEKHALDAQSIVSMNCWGFAPDTMFPRFGRDFAEFLRNRGSDPRAEFYLPTVVNNGIADGSLSVRMLYSGDRWFGMTYPGDREVVKKFIAEGLLQGYDRAAIQTA